LWTLFRSFINHSAVLLLILLRTQFESRSKFPTCFLVGVFPWGNAEILLTAGL